MILIHLFKAQRLTTSILAGPSQHRFCKKSLHAPLPRVRWLFSLRSRRLLEVVGTKKKLAPLACVPRARPFSLSLTTSKRLLRRILAFSQRSFSLIHALCAHVLIAKLNIYVIICPAYNFISVGHRFLL